MTDAVLPRWWGVTRNQLEAVTLYQEMGEQLLTAAASDAKLRPTVTQILVDGMVPQREEQVENALQKGDAESVLSQMMPAETFYLAAEFRAGFRKKAPSWMDRRGNWKNSRSSIRKK